MQPVLEIRGLTKRFVLHHLHGAEIVALAGMDLAVSAGECVVLAGPSGAGKSSLLRCVYGSYHADSGEILLHHGGVTTDIARASERTIIRLRRRTVGYVSQFLRVVPRIPALDVVAAPAIAAGLPRDAARERAASLLDRLGLSKRLWSLPPLTFSGGEQQRVNLARGFAIDYPLLLLDEPTAALDAENRRRVDRLIGEVLDRGTAILGVYHDDLSQCAFSARVLPMSGSRRDDAVRRYASAG